MHFWLESHEILLYRNPFEENEECCISYLLPQNKHPQQVGVGRLGLLTCLVVGRLSAVMTEATGPYIYLSSPEASSGFCKGCHSQGSKSSKRGQVPLQECFQPLLFPQQAKPVMRQSPVSEWESSQSDKRCKFKKGGNLWPFLRSAMRANETPGLLLMHSSNKIIKNISCLTELS